MSDDDELYGRPGNEAAQGLSPMPPVIPREDEEVKTYDSDKDGLESAARDLSKSRGEEREPLVDRAYTYYQGPQAGEKVEDSKTLTPERAAADLAQARWLEVQAIEDAENRQMADAVDSAKGVATESEVAEWVAQQQQAQEQAAQQSAPQTDVPPGMDEELAMLEAIKRMHDQYGASNPCATCAVERMLAVVIKAEPPRSWPKAEKALFATLDPALRAIIAKREQERETGLRRQQNKLAEEIKKLQQPPQPTEQKKEVTNV